MLKLRITGKLILGFCSVLVLMIIVSIIGFNGILKISNELDAVEGNSLPSIKAVIAMQKNFLEFKSAIRSSLIIAAPKEVRDHELGYLENIPVDLKKQWDIYDPIDMVLEERKIWDDFKEKYNSFSNQLNQFVTLTKKYNLEKENNSPNAPAIMERMYAIAFGDIRNKFKELEKDLKILVEINLKEAAGSKEASNNLKSTSKILLIVITIISLVIGILISLFISTKIIKKPINHVLSIFEKVTSGDLRTNAEIKTNDEFQILGENLNKMIAVRRKEIQDLLIKSKQINNSSSELFEISNQVADSSSEMNIQTQTAASSSEEVSANVTSVTTAAEEMTSSIKEISKNTTTASKITDEAQRKSNHASEVMNRLGVSSIEIGSILKAINSIAEQTNLLALNATIEAARAGESGKGFAVVANEVKELAKESAKATEDISHRIKLIQDDSNNAISAIKEITEINHQVNDITNTIASAVEEQTVTVNEVSRNLTEASRGVSSISEVTTGISAATNDFSINANKLKVSADDLKKIAISLEEELIRNYKL